MFVLARSVYLFWFFCLFVFYISHRSELDDIFLKSPISMGSKLEAAAAGESERPVRMQLQWPPLELTVVWTILSVVCIVRSG